MKLKEIIKYMGISAAVLGAYNFSGCATTRVPENTEIILMREVKDPKAGKNEIRVVPYEIIKNTEKGRIRVPYHVEKEQEHKK